MKTIVISDLHNRVSWVEGYLASTTYDEVIFLGDYFDNFYDSLVDIKRAAEWLKNSLKQRNRIHLWGNHDLWYAYPLAKGLHCSGNTREKQITIEGVLEADDWQHLRLCYFSQNFLFSHAGIHGSWALHPVKGFDYQYLTQICEADLEYPKCGQTPRTLRAGWSRGGDLPVGGITWLDYDTEFFPIAGVHQVCGHTPHYVPEFKLIPNKKYCTSFNVDLDTSNRHIGIIEDGKFSFVKNNFLPKH
jgi:hypothetical protein